MNGFRSERRIGAGQPALRVRGRQVALSVALVIIVLSIPARALGMKSTDACRGRGWKTCSEPGPTPSPSPSVSPSPSPSPSQITSSGPYRAFSTPSYWNQPLPPSVPVDPNSDAIVAFLKADSATNYIRLSGASSTGAWGNPVYWASASDPAYRIKNSCSFGQPPEMSSVRIPVGARPDATSDASMTIYDTESGLVYGLWHTAYDPATDTWSACGGTVYYLSSNGLAGSVPGSDQPKNTGHRGVPPPTYAVRYDEVRAGQIAHVLKIAVNTTGCVHVFPMAGDECGTSSLFAPPEGTRIRIKPGIDLTKLGLSPAALTIARALQRYGAVIGDQSGGAAELKLENTVAEGQGWKWNGILSSTSLTTIPLDDFEVVLLGYSP